MKAVQAKIIQSKYLSNTNSTSNLHILVDEIPNFKQIIHTVAFDERLQFYYFYARHKGFVNYFISSPKWGESNGEQEFAVWIWCPTCVAKKVFDSACATCSGEKYYSTNIKGVGASNPATMHNYFPPCVNVTLTDSPIVFSRGYTFIAGAVTLEFAQNTIKEFRLPVILIQKASSRNEIEWELSFNQK